MQRRAFAESGAANGDRYDPPMAFERSERDKREI